MELKTVTTKEELKELYTNWAMTWEGLRTEDFEYALEECSIAGKDGTGYVISGKVMNELCKLTGNNAYPDDLNIFAILNSRGLAINYGARWMTDIVDNNSIREHYHPFR